MKYLQTQQINPNYFFWRTRDKQEIDYLEEFNGQLTGFEIKWKIRKMKVPKTFSENYPNSELRFIDTENFESFIS